MVNYDESKANPYPNLPDPLALKNGKKVTSAKMWWAQRRPEIVEDFDREVYGRMPKVTPKVKWEVVSTTHGTNGDFAIVTKQLVGHVDNSAHPQITVDVQLTLNVPADVKGPVPVIMQFGGGPAGARGPAALGAVLDGHGHFRLTGKEHVWPGWAMRPSSPRASRPIMAPASSMESSDSSIRASHAKWMIGDPCAHGDGAPAAPSTTLRLTPRWTLNTSRSRVIRATEKPRLSRWRRTADVDRLCQFLG